ncbi:MAG: metal-dependent hydrolase [Proteobacteria bacterium]|nr:metal-dependent hydrolase [Pseudomonadota bacterium]
MHSMPIRTMQFGIDADEVKKDHLRNYVEYGISMTFPHLEPYLIRAMRVAIKDISDEKLAQDAKQFCGQEAQHYKQHAKLNDMIREISPKNSGLQEIEEQMAADYKRFLATKPLKFNLAYAEGFEAATSAMALTYLHNGVFDIENPTEFQRLFAWHLTEELEHRTVTFDVYDHLYGDYFYRLFVGIYAQWHFFRYVDRFAKLIKDNDPQPQGQRVTFVQELMIKCAWYGRVLRTYLPWYNPKNLKIPKSHNRHSREFSEQALDEREA